MHQIQALVATKRDAATLCGTWPGALRKSLAGGLSIVPLDVELVEHVLAEKFAFPDLEDPAQSADLATLMAPVLQALERVPFVEPVALLLTQYWGGTGAQAAWVLKGGSVALGPLVHPGAIHEALIALGVEAHQRRDAFEIVGLTRWRSMEDLCRGEPAEPPCEG